MYKRVYSTSQSGPLFVVLFLLLMSSQLLLKQLYPILGFFMNKQLAPLTVSAYRSALVKPTVYAGFLEWVFPSIVS